MRLWVVRILAVSLCFLATANFASANGVLLRLTESAMGRLLAETVEAQILFSKLRVPRGDWAAARERLAEPARARTRSEVEAQLTLIEEEFARLHGERRRSTPLAEDEAATLRRIASRELRVNPEWNIDAPHETHSFFSQRQGTRLAGSAENFRNSGRHDPALVRLDPSHPPTPRESRLSRRYLNQQVERMKQCRSEHSASQVARSNFNFKLRQLGADSIMTVAGAMFVSAAGTEEVDWRTLPSDLVFEAISSLGSSQVTAIRGRLAMRWFRLGGAFGLAQSSGDAVIYYFSPITDTHGLSRERATGQRFLYNFAFDGAMAPINIGLYELFMGLDCLYPSGAGHMAALGLQFGSGLATNIAYFGLRNLTIGSTHH